MSCTRRSALATTAGCLQMGSQERSPGSGGYVRFIILSAARTGSNLLASSLNSSPEIVCFREIFKVREKHVVDYNVAGYDRFNGEDLALRSDDFKAFLRERIFCSHPVDVHAVGFKMPYNHFWGYEGLLPWLADDEELRVVHLQRRNILRMLLSLRVAEQTGVYLRPAPPSLRRRVISTLKSRARRALRRPPAEVDGRREDAGIPMSEPATASTAKAREPVSISPEELVEFIVKTELAVDHFEGKFSGHPMRTVYYEDMLESRKKTLTSVQSFLDVKPERLAERTQRQNPEPLAKLIENFDELRAAFRPSEHAWMFEEA